MAYLRQLSGEPGGWASTRVRLGRALADRMPATASAWQSGQLGLNHAQVIRDATERLDEQLGREVERVLAEAAPALSPGELADLAATIKAQAAPEDSETAAAKNHGAQTVKLSKTFDGMWRLDGWLDSETGAYLSHAIAAFTRPRDPEATILEDLIGLRRAEALLQLARHALAHAEGCSGEGGSRHTMLITTSLETLQTGLGTAAMPGGGMLTAAAARRLSCDSGLIPAVLGTDSEILDLGRQARLPSAGIRKILIVRDGGCVFPGCDRPPSFTEAHHRTHWAHGGTTSPENLDLFCVFHHHLLHEGGWTYHPQGPHALHFHPPHQGPVRISTRRPLTRNASPMRT